MKLPEYITVQEVKRVCKDLGISDWTKKKKAVVSAAEAKRILAEVNAAKMAIDLEDFRKGLEVELEHGVTFTDANVTNNHPVLTGLIVVAHFKESLDYYKLLEVAEVEGDLVKAVVANDPAKVRKYFQKLAKAKIELAEAELKRLK
jgi:hypothetical protein